MAATITVRVDPSLTYLDIGGVRYPAVNGYVKGIPADQSDALEEAGFPVLYNAWADDLRAAWAAQSMTVRVGAVLTELTVGQRTYPAVNGYITGVPAQYEQMLSSAGFLCLRQPACWTPDGGLAVLLTNRSGAPSVRGHLINTGGASGGFVVNSANAPRACGVVYESGVPDGSPCLVVTGGVAYVLFEDGQQPVVGQWCGVGTSVDGRAYTRNTFPTNPVTEIEVHAAEIGHCLDSVSPGTDVLARVVLHFN